MPHPLERIDLVELLPLLPSISPLAETVEQESCNDTQNYRAESDCENTNPGSEEGHSVTELQSLFRIADPTL